MGRELVIPAKLPGFAVQSDDRTRVKVVAAALVADHVVAGVSCGPINKIRRRIIRPGHPCDCARMLNLVAFPSLRSRFTGLRHGPESPDFFAGRWIERGDKSTGAFVASSRARDYEATCNQGSRRGVVVLMPIRHLRVP